jgi:hypothetical protein
LAVEETRCRSEDDTDCRFAVKRSDREGAKDAKVREELEKSGDDGWSSTGHCPSWGLQIFSGIFVFPLRLGGGSSLDIEAATALNAG